MAMRKRAQNQKTDTGKEGAAGVNDTVLTEEVIEKFRKYLICAERSALTIDKYIRDVRAFAKFAKDREVNKELIATYKQKLISDGYAACSINSMLSSINSLFTFLGRADLRVKRIRVQKQIYCAEGKELTKAEYMRLLKASEDDKRLRLILETICGTGIRISELSYFTAEAVRQGEVTVSCKNKTRVILIPGKLRKLLLSYCKEERINTGMIFRTKKGKPLDRSGIWRKMKALCEKAGVAAAKVFPHNLRKLFARTFYSREKDIAKLADILGHSSIETTRIYIMTTEREHRRKIEQLGLVM